MADRDLCLEDRRDCERTRDTLDELRHSLRTALDRVDRSPADLPTVSRDLRRLLDSIPN